VLSQDDFSGTSKVHLAAALGRIGDPDDMPDLSRLIQADLARLHRGLAALLAGERSDRVNGASMRCGNWYVGAVVTLDPARAEDILLGLLWEPEYEDDAAAALVRLAVQEREAAGPGLSRAVDYDAVWKARALDGVEARDQGRRARYGAELKRRIEALLDELAASREPNAYDHRLKRLAARIATLDGAASAGMVLHIMARPGRFDEWIRLEALEALFVRGAHLPRDAVLSVLEPVIGHAASRGRSDQQARDLLNRCLCLLPFVDPPDDGIVRARELLVSTPLHGYELRPFVRALGHSRCPGALPVLLDIATQAAGSLSAFAAYWVDALAALGTADSERVLLSAIDADLEVSEVSGLSDPDVRAPLATSITKIVRDRPDEKEHVLQLCDRSLGVARRTLLADGIAALGERDAVLRGLNLLRDDTAPLVPRGIWHAVESAALEHRPLGTNTYSLLPASAHDIRRRLFEMAMSDHARRRAALALLGQIEEWRVDYGRPGGEPRHPDIDSGVPWPPTGIPG
jgi:hypothetical protein